MNTGFNSGCFLFLQERKTDEIEFISFSQVHIMDNFWKPKIDKVATVTLKSCIEQTEIKTPRIRNFEKVAKTKAKSMKGFLWRQWCVQGFEAMAYSLQTHPSAEMEKRSAMNGLIRSRRPSNRMATWIHGTHSKACRTATQTWACMKITMPVTW